MAYLSDPANTVLPFAITHPPEYDGSGGALDISVCVLTGSEALEGPTSRAIQTWNALVPTIGNCSNCFVWEEGFNPGETFHAETTLIHELGHCPLGLEHPDRNWDAADDGIWEPTSFTRSWDVASPPTGIDAGPDFIRGTLDDEQVSLGGLPDAVHWFRRVDNNPFAIDATVIDSSTFSRSAAANLPAGHSWAANANRVVGEELGLQDTQSVMYSRQDPATRRLGLTSDDVSTIRMASTGVDLVSGTADDYAVNMHLVSDCVGADVLITFGEPVGQGSLAECITSVDFSFPQNPLLARHISLVPLGGLSEPLLITLDQAVEWITDESLVFASGFESGDLSGWDNVVP